MELRDLAPGLEPAQPEHEVAQADFHGRAIRRRCGHGLEIAVREDRILQRAYVGLLEE